MLPAITEIIRVDHFGARSLEHGREKRRALTFYARHPHKRVRGFWVAEAVLADTELMHVLVIPSHPGLQNVVQLRQGQICRNQEAAPDGRLGSKQSDLELIDILSGIDLSCRWWAFIRLGSMLRYDALRPSSGYATESMRSGVSSGVHLFCSGHLMSVS